MSLASLTVPVSLALGSCAFAQSAVRTLPDQFQPPSPPITVSIAISSPGGVIAVGLEDRPPSGWPVSNISHSGSFDSQSRKVKWGPFFAPSIPAAVTYDLAPVPGGPSSNCFTGAASFDGLDHSISGDACILAIPATSTWTLIALAELLAIAATRLLGKRTVN